MASSVPSDQAAGLRRLMAGDFVRTLGLVYPDGGAAGGPFAGALAQALAGLGRRVAVIDTLPDATGVGHYFSLPPSPDLGQVLRSGQPLARCVAATPAGVRVVAARRAPAALADLAPDGCAAFAAGLLDALRPVDTFLVNACPGVGAETLAMAAAAQDLLVIVPAKAEHVTAAYALIKALNQAHGRRRFLVYFDGGADADGARRMFDRMRAAAERFIDARLSWAGCIDRSRPLSGSGLAGHYMRLARVLEAADCPPDETAGASAFLHRLAGAGRRMAHKDFGYA